MPRKESGETEEYNPRWDLGLSSDGWPRAVSVPRGGGEILQPCPACNGSHPLGKTPIKCLTAIGLMLERNRVTEDDE